MQKIEEKYQVLLEWKKAYIQAIIDALHPSGDVLEVGFNFGIGAECIQQYQPKSHTIIEEDPERFEFAKKWASGRLNVAVIAGSWQKVLPGLPVFDTIFFNENPATFAQEILIHQKQEEIANIANVSKELLNTLEEEFARVDVHYSDKEIDEFYEQVGQFNVKELPRFFENLQKKGFITKSQYASVLKRYKLDQAQSDTASSMPLSASDPMIGCLQECLKAHMRKGSLFSSYCVDCTSKYENPEFFEKVITNLDVDYQERVLSLQVAKFSEYFTFNQAVIMLVRKLA
jgi:hypothetical protein